MTDRRAREKSLLEKLARELSESGFEPKPILKNNAVRRHFPLGFHELHVAMPSWGDEIEAVPSVGVRIDAIEDLGNEGAGLSRSQAAETATVGTSFDRLGGKHAWTVESDADVDAAVRGILADFARVGEAYLQRFSSVEEILRVCSRDDEAAELAMRDPGLRAKIALAAACVLGDKSELEALLVKKVDWLKKSDNAAEIPLIRAFAKRIAKQCGGSSAGAKKAASKKPAVKKPAKGR
jgi:hypothetical protein